ncbi:MAG: PEP-CTERM sorting domain-containing protein [Pirellulaceae bacterium]|nr:PEP-CTERM sorting domain-containing protein [Pirellulaceae bacterium]
MRQWAFKRYRVRVLRRARFLGLLLGCAVTQQELFAQTNVYWNNTTVNARNWAGINGNGNGLWRTTPSGGTFQVGTTINDIANFNSDLASTGTQDVYTGDGQAAYGIIFGVGATATGPFRIRASFNANTTRTFTIGAGGITVNSTVQGVSFNTTDVNTGTPTGQLNTVLQASQNWTNHSAKPLTFSGRLVGADNVSLTKAGTGTLVLGNDNQTVTVGTTSGFRGRLNINEGLVMADHNNALGVRDPLTSALSSAAIGPLKSDTVIASGATLDTNNRQLGNEFISVSGSGINGNGAIVNNNSSAVVTNTLGQVRMLGNTTFGGTGYWDISPLASQRGKLFQDGFTLTKRGSNYMGFTNTDVVGGGNIDIQNGRITMFRATNIDGAGTITVGSAASLGFQDYTGNFTRDIVFNGGSLVSTTSGTSTINSNVTFNGQSNLFINSTSVGPGRGATTNLAGPVRANSYLHKYGNGVLGLNLDTGLGSASIKLLEGGIDIINTVPANAFIDVYPVYPSTSLGGEGRITGVVDVHEFSDFSLYFDPTTTGPTEHLRVGNLFLNNVIAKVVPLTPIASGSGIVVFESDNNNIVASQFQYNGRGSLSTNGNKLFLDYQTGSLVWRGNDVANPSKWDTLTTTNWTNTSTSASDLFYEGDIVTFDDSVGGGSSIVRPNGVVTASGMTLNNSAVNYTFTPATTSSRIVLNGTGLVKSGTGTANFQTIVGGLGHGFSSTDVQAGILDFTSSGTGSAVKSDIGPITIHSGGMVRNNLNVTDVGIGENPVTVQAGGVYELTRGAVPNGTSTTPGTIAIRSSFSGAGDVRLNGVQQSGFNDSFGAYTLAQDNSGFSGKWLLHNARLQVDNAQGDELGTGKVVAPQGSQVRLNADSTRPYEGNVFEIAGTDWAFPTASEAGSGVLRFSTNGATIAANSSVVLTGNARISSAGILGRIDAPISGGFDLEIGNPTATQNGTIILGSHNSYTGSTTIANQVVMANQNGALSTGNIALNGSGGARVTQLAVGKGVDISSNISVSTQAGQSGRGAIEGGSLTQNAELGTGISTVSGPINLAGSMPTNYGHFGSGNGTGSILRVTGPINIANPSTQAVSHRSSTPGGYTQFNGGGGNYTKFNLVGGTVRLGANDGLNSGIELITRTASGASTFDMYDFNQTLSSIARGSSVTGSTFSLVNTGSNVSTLTLTGNGDSEIQDIAFSPNGGSLNIVKNGSGLLVIPGSGSGNGIQNLGTYSINGGTLKIGESIEASVNINNATLAAGFRIKGASTINNGVLSPGNSIGTMTFGNDLSISGDNTLVWESVLTIPASGAISSDVIIVDGHLDLTNLTSFLVDPLAAQIVMNDPLGTFSWLLIDSPFPILGFNPSDFSVDSSPFVDPTLAPVPGSFTVGLGDSGTALFLNYSPSAVPEPTSIFMTGVGLSIFLLRRKSKPT